MALLKFPRRDRLTRHSGAHIIPGMDTQTVMLLAVLISVIGGHWKLHTDITGLQERMASLQERMARLEGLFEGYTGRGAQTSST